MGGSLLLQERSQEPLEFPPKVPSAFSCVLFFCGRTLMLLRRTEKPKSYKVEGREPDNKNELKQHGNVTTN